MTNTLTTQDTGPESPRAGRSPAWIPAIAAAVVGAALLAGSLLGVLPSPLEATQVTEGTGVTPTSTQATDTGAKSIGAVLTDVSTVATGAVDAVVVVDVVFDTRGPFDTSGSGSGVIFDEEGLIITNAHLVEGASSISVELTDGSTYTAAVLAEDASVDIAILDIDASELTAIELGSTDDLSVGDPVIAIGNPLALEGGPSVSTGIVSALDRVLEDEGTTLTGIIQTDAAITEGSSGGALLDADGHLVGITTAVGVSSVGVEGIAFAVPIETVSDVVATLVNV